MLFFNKKKKEEPEECAHKWMDFDWYITTDHIANSDRYRVRIMEPYVCVHCKARKDVVLAMSSTPLTAREVEGWIEYHEKQYGDKIKPVALVEDAIHDALLVDRDYINSYKEIMGIKEKDV